VTLLNIDANPKTVKGQKQGYLTAVLYLAPFKAAGINVCAMAELAGCINACLNTAGRGGIAKASATFNPHGIELPDNVIQRARINRTRLQLVKEVKAFIRKAEKLGLIPVVRLNGTSDIQWELIPVGDAANIFELFPDVQFYDYTKICKRLYRRLPANYYLAISYSEYSERYAKMALAAFTDTGAPLVIVVRGQSEKDLALLSSNAVDGDAHDLIFLHKPHSVIVLKAKGRARKDTSGFVVSPQSELTANRG
jgi:hypothetical protein